MPSIATLTLLAALAAAQAPPGLLGRWRSAGTSGGGLGAMIEFLDDGTLKFSAAVVVDMQYRIEGDRLIFPPGSIGGPEQRQMMKWVDADHLLLNEIQLLSRQGSAKDPAKLIVGEWTFTREEAGRKLEGLYLFDAAGKCTLLLPFAWQGGRYSVKGSIIRLEFPGGPVEGPFHLEGDALSVPSSGKAGPFKLKRY